MLKRGKTAIVCFPPAEAPQSAVTRVGSPPRLASSSGNSPAAVRCGRGEGGEIGGGKRNVVEVVQEVAVAVVAVAVDAAAKEAAE